LRKSILMYLKSKKLKKRNANFLEVYQRINSELKERKMIFQKEEVSAKEGFVKVDFSCRKTRSSSDANSTFDIEEPRRKDSLLGRKHSMNIQVEIPSFLNDKKQNVEVHAVKNKKVVKADEPDKPAFKKCLNGTLYKILIFNFKLDFGKGLFDAKLDLDLSDNMETYKIQKQPHFEVELKEIELKSALFNAVPEDMFFSLD